MPTQPRRRWFRFVFNLRTMFALVVVFAIPIAWSAKEGRQSEREQQIAKQLTRPDVWDIGFGGPYDNWDDANDAYFIEPKSWWHSVSRELLGERILAVSVQGASEGKFDLSDISDLLCLQFLDLSYVETNHFECIDQFTALKKLRLLDSNVTDLAPLARLTKLELISLAGTAVSDEQVATLQEALPHCKIER